VLWLAVCLVGAGEAELCITVIDPSGQTVPFDVEPTPNGQRITYVPECPGTYKVNTTYGGINVPGNFYAVLWNDINYSSDKILIVKCMHVLLAPINYIIQHAAKNDSTT